MKQSNPVAKKITMARHHHSAGFSTVGVRSSLDFEMDPFLNVDFFTMSEPTFPPHPHAGFSAVTYMLPESPGAFQNRDSFGDRSLIEPGSIHWTQAGTGMIHEEVPIQAGVDCKGFQIFVNLSRKNKSLAPVAFHADKSAIPEIVDNDGLIRVVAGTYRGRVSTLTGLATPVSILDTSIRAGREFSVDLDPGLNWSVFVISGGGAVASDETIAANEVFLVERRVNQLTFDASSAGLRLLIFGGVPIGEPIVWGGPFCLDSVEALRLANQRFRNGEMGTLDASF